MPDGPGGWGLPSHDRGAGGGFAALLRELKVPWPACNQDAARQAAEAWRTLAEAVEGVGARCTMAVAGLTENNDGQAIDAFATYWQKYGGRSGVLPLTGEACRAIAAACDTLADKVSEVKTEIEHRAEELAATIVAMAAALILTWGASAGVSEAVAAATVRAVTDLVEGLADTIAFVSRTLAEDVGFFAGPVGAVAGATAAGATAKAITGTFAGLFDQIFQGTIDVLNGEPLPSAKDTVKNVYQDAKTGILLGVLAEATPAIADELTSEEMTAQMFSVSPQLALMLSDSSKFAAWLDTPPGRAFIGAGGIVALRKQGLLDETGVEGKVVETVLDGALSELNPGSDD